VNMVKELIVILYPNGRIFQNITGFKDPRITSFIFQNITGFKDLRITSFMNW
jgi:hypothetical protein